MLCLNNDIPGEGWRMPNGMILSDMQTLSSGPWHEKALRTLREQIKGPDLRRFPGGSQPFMHHTSLDIEQQIIDSK
jgi:hypothetical protein